jgi:hypothetical protein
LFEASGPAIPSCQLFGEAADEIERLQAVVDAAKAARTTDEYGLLSVEKGWDLDKALAALEEQDDDYSD